LRALLFAAAALLAACGSERSQMQSDWERENEGRLAKEQEQAAPAPQPPPYPRGENLLPFAVSAVSEFKFFIDRASLSVGKDGIVRYVLVARSANGAENVSFEAISCPTGEYRIYAIGAEGGKWISSPSAWRRIEPRSVQRWHNVLYREYFCPYRFPIADPAEGILALEQGGHWRLRSK
jgi:hypothetical protein